MMTPGTFDELRKKLEESITSFPYIYMFKFIIKADNKTMALVEVIFDDDADIIQKQSTKGNFISITVKQVVMNVDEIIAIYEKAAEIEGVMSL
jgi:putative lipoic acid-binding regulatory protein